MLYSDRCYAAATHLPVNMKVIFYFQFSEFTCKKNYPINMLAVKRREMSKHQSDSSEQQTAEKYILVSLQEQLGINFDAE